MSAAAPAVRLRNLRCAAAPLSNLAVLRGIDLDVASGEQIAVIGASGSGKSTLLNALACAVKPMQGELELFGEDPWALSSRRRQKLRGRLCLAPQVPPLPPRQRVVTSVLAGTLPTLSLWQSLQSLWHPRNAALAYDALLSLDLGEKLWERVDRLSGGERQRVGLARLLVADAPLWLIDEPLSALDPARAEQAITRLTEAARESNRSLVCSLHQVDMARLCFSRIVALRDGQVVYDGAAAELDEAMVRDLYGQELLVDTDRTPVAESTSHATLPLIVCR
ncbi:MAG: ATP-binding cassette domain-containing protein [Ideonella sp.]